MRSLISIQILAAVICFCCISYFFIFIYDQRSVRNIIEILSVGFQQSQLEARKLLPGKSIALTGKANSSTESYICSAVKNDHLHNRTSSLSFQLHRFNALQPYCDILPTPRNKWISAKRYTESDIVFIIYTGAAFYHNRATAVRDTWLSRVTHKYYFSSTPYSPLPVTVIEGAGEDYKSNMKKLYRGLQLAYQEHNNTAKFYYLAGCDTFVNVPHILKRLENSDYRRPLIVGGFPFGHDCYQKKNNTVGSVNYPSGGAGFFLSASVMEMMYPKIGPFFENDWPTEERPYSDVAINCLAQSMGVRPTFVSGFWAFSPEQTLKDSGRKRLHADPEPNTFHYVNPTSMHILDEFYVFQHIDRLANDRNLDELVKFTRKFVGAHYELLRIKQAECTLPPIKPTRK